jgi:hypothetical protein
VERYGRGYRVGANGGGVGGRVSVRVLIVDDHAVVRGGLRVIVDAAPDMETIGEAGNP